MAKFSLWTLLVSVALLCLGHGLSGSLVSVTANAADFGTGVTGFVMAGYSAGLLISTFITPRLVKSVGHVRTFSGLASIVSTVVLLFPLGSSDTEVGWDKMTTKNTGSCFAASVRNTPPQTAIAIRPSNPAGPTATGRRRDGPELLPQEMPGIARR